MKFLIVDDNPNNSELLKKMLQKYGEIDIANDGNHAISLFLSAHKLKVPYSGVFLDIMMPQKDGYEVLTEIRKWESENLVESPLQVKVVMTTSLHDTDTVVKSYDTGCQHYLLKPFNKDDLFELMENFQ